MATANDSQAFLSKLFDDPGFRQQFMSLKSPDAVMSAAKQAGYSFTPQQMKQTLSNEKGLASLSDNQLDSIASASASGWVGAGGTAAGAAVGAGAAAAACV